MFILSTYYLPITRTSNIFTTRTSSSESVITLEHRYNPLLRPVAFLIRCVELQLSDLIFSDIGIGTHSMFSLLWHFVVCKSGPQACNPYKQPPSRYTNQINKSLHTTWRNERMFVLICMYVSVAAFSYSLLKLFIFFVFGKTVWEVSKKFYFYKK